MRALTGVGPAIASGSQVWSGSCADFPSAPPQQQCRGGDGRPRPDRPRLQGALHQRLDLQRAQAGRQQEQSDGHGRVADSRDNEGFLSRSPVGGVVVPEADQQVAAEPDPLPAQVEQEQVVRQDQRQHGRHEEVHVGEEAAESDVFPHEFRGVHMNQESHEGDNQRHDQGQRIQVQRNMHVQARKRHPAPEGLCVGPLGGWKPREADRYAGSRERRQAHRAHPHRGRGPAGQASAERGEDEEAGQAPRRDQPQKIEHPIPASRWPHPHPACEISDTSGEPLPDPPRPPPPPWSG